jgi:hypothetical protein
MRFGPISDVLSALRGNYRLLAIRGVLIVGGDMLAMAQQGALQALGRRRGIQKRINEQALRAPIEIGEPGSVKYPAGKDRFFD